MPNELHVIFGGGQVGQPLARILHEPVSASGWRDAQPARRKASS
jgi:hypothetical protein